MCLELDYRKLCVDLFGTDNAEELKKIAATLNERNPRNAGRKRKLSNDDVNQIRILKDNGVTINEIAKRYNTSRQIISKYLNSDDKIADGCTLRITYMNQETPCTVIDVDFMNERILIQNKTDDLIHRAFGINEQPTWDDFEIFLRDRCFPETRGNKKSILRSLGLDYYDPLAIVEKTQGRISEDNLWMKFKYYPRKDLTNA